MRQGMLCDRETWEVAWNRVSQFLIDAGKCPKSLCEWTHSEQAQSEEALSESS